MLWEKIILTNIFDKTSLGFILIDIINKIILKVILIDVSLKYYFNEHYR